MARKTTGYILETETVHEGQARESGVLGTTTDHTEIVDWARVPQGVSAHITPDSWTLNRVNIMDQIAEEKGTATYPEIWVGGNPWPLGRVGTPQTVEKGWWG